MKSGEKGGPAETSGIEWKAWSQESFDEAERAGKLVLLDLTATWCHWCHVMDGTTYSDKEVVDTINREFVPVRVDIDQRPDISERYNRGGFPTTAFLSHRGESIWGATYIPPSDMKRVLDGILKAKRSGEIDKALARPVRHPESRGVCPERKHAELPSKEEVEQMFDEVFDTYDAEHGGFGLEPKFPHPDAVDLLATRNIRLRDPGLAEAVEHTLIGMAEGLYDRAEGGVFRYSVTRDWSVPHYEKMLETNLGYLRNLARAHVLLGGDRYRELAEGVAGYLLKTLRDQASGAFFGSQDADEEYYMLSAQARSRRLPPSVDRSVYSGWNALASATLTEAGTLLGRPDIIDSGLAALDNVMRSHWDDDKGMVRHSEGQGLFLSEDQVELLGALLAAMQVRGTADHGPFACRLADSVQASFRHKDGGLGDIMGGDGGIGALSEPTRSLVTNSKWAHRLSLLGAALERPDLVEEAASTLRSFDPETVRAHGVFAAPYITAVDALRKGPVKVEVHLQRGRPEASGLWTAVAKALEPGAVVVPIMDGEGFAVVCSPRGCSQKIMTSEELIRVLRGIGPGQV